MTFDLDRSIAVLERTPAALERLLSGLPEEWIARNEGAGSWSPFDVVGHLIHGERTDWMPRARLILETGEQPAFTPFDRFAQFEASRGRPLGDLLEEFASLRRENLETLRGWRLGAADLTKTGTHPAFGRVTLSQLLAAWVVHDLGHIVQISRTMANQYAEAIGPWKEYLMVIKR